MSVATTTKHNLTNTENNTTGLTTTTTSPAFDASVAAAVAMQANVQLKAVMTGITNEINAASSSTSTTNITTGSTNTTATTKTQSTSCTTGTAADTTFMCETTSDMQGKTSVGGTYANLISDNTVGSCIRPIAGHLTTTASPNGGHLLNDLSYIAVGDIHTKNASQQKGDQLQQQLQQQARLNDDRTLQLALELSLVSLNDDPNCFFEQQKQQPQQHHAYALTSQHHQHTTTQLQKTEFDVGTLNAITAVIAANHSSSHGNIFSSNTSSAVSGLLIPTNVLEDRSKKSQNMTECVPVPSSEHVAEIVGRQGCKIKALRAKTNTYIKTPVRGEEPVFVVTGRKEDVNKAKREILSAADHFSLIRATRKPSSSSSIECGESHNVNLNGASGGAFANGTVACGGSRGTTTTGPPSLPGQVTIQVRVPYRVVGLVVGPKGATIKHIQQETQTYIVTPSREKEPIFEVTGLPENVQTARKQIEAHIALRTGNNNSQNNNGSVGNNNNAALVNLAKASEQLSELPPNVHTINTLSQILNDDINSEFLASLYENGICSAGLEYADDALVGVGHGNINVGVGTAGTPPPLNFNAASAGYPNAINAALIANNRFQVQQQHTQQQQQGIQAINSSIGECSTTAVGGSSAHLEMTHESVIFQRNSDAKIRHELQSIKNHGHNNVVTVTNNGLTRSCSSASSTTSTKSTNNSAAGSSSTNSTNSPPELLNIWKNLGDSLDVDEGIGDSPNIWHLPTTLSALTGGGSHCSPNTSISPTDSLLGEINAATANQQLQRHIAAAAAVASASNSTKLLQDHQMLSDIQRAPLMATNGDRALSMRRECFVCNEREVTTALVPCGHNMFCMDCANHICVSMDSICPVCNSIVYHAMRIIA